MVYNLSGLGELRKGGNRVKKIVAAVALGTALLAPATMAQAAVPCRVCVEKCGYGYRVYWYDLDGRYRLLFNGCIY